MPVPVATETRSLALGRAGIVAVTTWVRQLLRRPARQLRGNEIPARRLASSNVSLAFAALDLPLERVI